MSSAHAQTASLTGPWSGQFEDRFLWEVSSDSTTLYALCEGILDIQFEHGGAGFGGTLTQYQRCRFGDDPWYEEVFDGWHITAGAVSADSVAFTTRAAQGDLGIQVCSWTGRLDGASTMTGNYECTFTEDAAARAWGTFQISRRN